MAGEAVDVMIKRHQARHPGMTHVEAFREVVGAEEPDAEVERYKRGTAAEVAEIKSLEGQLRGVAGEYLHAAARRHKGQTAASYAEALREAAHANPEAGRSYGIEEPKVAPRPWWMR